MVCNGLSLILNSELEHYITKLKEPGWIGNEWAISASSPCSG
jgi:hypothetical protein